MKTLQRLIESALEAGTLQDAHDAIAECDDIAELEVALKWLGGPNPRASNEDVGKVIGALRNKLALLKQLERRKKRLKETERRKAEQLDAIMTMKKAAEKDDADDPTP